MLEQKWYPRNRLLVLILSIILAGCNFPSLSTSNYATQEVPEDPTSPPIETQVPVIEPTSPPTEVEITEPSPSATIALAPELPGHCRPFPDQIFPWPGLGE